MRRLCLLLILTIILLTGCETYNNINPTNPYLTPVPSATPMGELVVVPKEGGTITLGVSRYSSLNPLLTDNEDIKYYMGLVYDSMYYLDYRLKEVNNLASSGISEDNGLTWIIELRNDVKWHNGNSFGATDCLYTIDYIQRNGGLYEANIANIDQCVFLTEFSFSITLKKPDLYFLSKLTFPVIPSSFTGIGSTPMGTSMFKYKETVDNRIILERNDSYWGDKPYIDKIEIVKYDNERLKHESESDILILQGENVARYLNKNEYRSERFTGRNFTCFVPNMNNKSVLNDVNVRKAISYAIDKSIVVKSAISGYGVVASWPVIPGTRYYQDSNASYARDLKKAEQYLGLAGYIKADDGRWYKQEDRDKKNPLTIPCNVMSSNNQMRNCASVLKKQIEELGITFTIVYNSDDDFMHVLGNGNYTAALVDIDVGTWPELELLFATKAEMNVNGYSNEILDGLLADMYEQENISLRLAEIKAILEEDLPLIGLYFSQEAIVMSEKILGRTADVFFWQPLKEFNKIHLYTEGVIS